MGGNSLKVGDWIWVMKREGIASDVKYLVEIREVYDAAE